MKRPTQAQMQKAVAQFNHATPIGAIVQYWPGAKEGRRLEGTVTDPGAYILGGHTAVVQIEGAGCVALSHIEVLPRFKDQQP